MVVCSSKQTCLFPQRLIGQFPRRWQIFDRNVRVIDLCRFVEWKVQSLKRIFHGERTPEELIYSIILSIRSIFFKLTTRSIQKYQYKNRFKNFKSSFAVKLFGIIDRSLIEKKKFKNNWLNEERSWLNGIDSKNRPFESENIKKVWKNFFSRPLLFTWRKVSIRESMSSNSQTTR